MAGVVNKMLCNCIALTTGELIDIPRKRLYCKLTSIPDGRYYTSEQYPYHIELLLG